MKKTITMTCILKSGVKIEETIKLDSKDTKVFKAIERIRIDIENYLANSNSDKGQFTFGKTTIAMSEIAAVSFKE
jgi:phage-related protein